MPKLSHGWRNQSCSYCACKAFASFLSVFHGHASPISCFVLVVTDADGGFMFLGRRARESVPVSERALLREWCGISGRANYDAGVA